MIIKNIPQSVYRQAALLMGSDGKGVDDNWSWENEYHLIADKQGFTNSELEQAIGVYLINGGDWRSE